MFKFFNQIAATITVGCLMPLLGWSIDEKSAEISQAPEQAEKAVVETTEALAPMEPEKPVTNREPVFHDALLTEIKALQWQTVQQAQKPLSLSEALEIALKNNLDIQISEEKIQETEAKENTIEGRRFLFLFKFLSFQYLEGAAESDVLASKENLLATRNKALLDTTTYYTELMRAVMKTYIDWQAIQQGLKQLQFNERQFESGETTNIELMQTKTRLIQLYQNYLKSKTNQQLASIQLKTYLGLDYSEAVYPNALSFNDGGFNIEGINSHKTIMPLTEAKSLAQQQRPELKELAYKLESIENIVKVNLNRFDKNQVRQMRATTAQAKLRLEKANRLLNASVAESHHKALLAKEQFKLARQQFELAENGLRQVLISHKAGFSSNKDVLDMQVGFSQAQVNYANAQLEEQLSQVRLLYELGQISKDSILSSEV